jgi:ATP-binding cassette subfamily B protein
MNPSETSTTLNTPSSSSDQRSVPRLSTLLVNIRLIRYASLDFILHSVFILLFFGLQVVPGLIVKQVFDTIGGAPASGTPPAGEAYLWGLIGLYLLAELVRMFSSLGGEWYGWTFRLAVGALLQRNLFASILRRPGDLPLPVSTGEALNRFDEDVGEVGDFPTWIPDQVGKWIAAIIAVIIMASINLTITGIVFLPLIGVSFFTRWAWKHIIYYRKASAVASDAVSGFLGEMFSAVQAIQVANAEDHITTHLELLGDRRAYLDTRWWVGRLGLDILNNSMVTFGTGVILLLAGTAISKGTFTVGDFALFVSYLWFTTAVPSELGTFYGDYKTQEVSIERMLDLIRPESPVKLVEPHPVYTRGPIPPVPPVPRTEHDRLEALEVRGLTYGYKNTDIVGAGEREGGQRPPDHASRPAPTGPAPTDPTAGDNARASHEPASTDTAPTTSSPRGIEDVNLSLRRGDFVVITGRVGSGKSTLVRVLLGLLPRQEGEIRWNGKTVADPAEFFRPPRCAYTPQVPRLFSDTLRDNILLGLPDDPSTLAEAVHLSVLEQDITQLERGLETLVGPRGLRLSGGQVQRAAAARMFMRQPELLVFDDLSSALDVETEQALWERLETRLDSGEAMTCLVVSHRKAALARADHIVVMKDGRVEAEGKLDDLLESCTEMQQLWSGEAQEERP